MCTTPRGAHQSRPPRFHAPVMLRRTSPIARRRSERHGLLRSHGPSAYNTLRAIPPTRQMRADRSGSRLRREVRRHGNGPAPMPFSTMSAPRTSTLLGSSIPIRTPTTSAPCTTSRSRPAPSPPSAPRSMRMQDLWRDLYNLPPSFRTDGSQWDCLLRDGDTIPIGNLTATRDPVARTYGRFRELPDRRCRVRARHLVHARLGNRSRRLPRR